MGVTAYAERRRNAQLNIVLQCCLKGETAEVAAAKVELPLAEVERFYKQFGKSKEIPANA